MKNSRSTLLIESENGNNYLYNMNTGSFTFCSQNFKDIVLKNYYNENVKHYEKTQNEEEIYCQYQYNILKNNGYFSEYKPQGFLIDKINADEVKENLANVKQIVFEVTDRCNLKCKYCGYGEFYTFNGKRESNDLDIEIAKNVIVEILDFKKSSIGASLKQIIGIGFYGGEPLLNFAFIEGIVEFVKKFKTDNKFVFTMTTNGVLLNKYQDFLVENDFIISISLDGNKENNDYRVYHNGKSSWETVFNNIMSIKKSDPKYFDRRISFISVLHNKNSTEEILNYFESVFQKNTLVLELDTNGINEERKDEFNKMFNDLNEDLSKIEERSKFEKKHYKELPNWSSYSDLFKMNNDLNFETYQNLNHQQKIVKRNQTGTCLPFSTRVFVTVDGKILPCEKIDQQLYLGNATKSELNLDYEKIAAKYNKYFDQLSRQCTTCYSAKLCKLCMFSIQNLDTDKPICHLYTSEKDMVSIITEKINYFEKHQNLLSKIYK